MTAETPPNFSGLEISHLPAGVLLKVMDNLPVESVLQCRSVCSKWNAMIQLSELLDLKSCFVFDGRKDDATASACSSYMESSAIKSTLWSHLKFRRMGARQSAWVFDQIDNDPQFSYTISTLELLNSTLNWATILQLMIELDNLEVFIDRQDMYCWDYATFNSGIEESETILETAGYQQLRHKEKLGNLRRLRVAIIHRSQLTECTTYLKILQLKCESLRTLQISTDQNFAPQRATLFYTHLAQLLTKSGESLKVLNFPYKLVGPTYDFRTTDEHRLFSEFINFVVENGWSTNLNLPVLEELSIQFGIVPLEGQEFSQKLAPFLQSLPKLKKFFVGCIQLESGMERFLEEFLRLVDQSLVVKLGIFMNDGTGIPNILGVQHSLKSLSIQTFRDLVTEMHELVPLFGLGKFQDLEEFQYFGKNHTFKNFNLDQLIESFCKLTHLNLVDHNARLETRHSCEALATIENEDMQLLFKSLKHLVSLQLIGNMTFLTDEGLTGMSNEACKRILKSSFISIGQPADQVGVAVSCLQKLKSFVLRGLGIKITDVTAYYAFNSLPVLRKLHLFGCHQISPNGRTYLNNKYNVTRGCDLQV